MRAATLTWAALGESPSVFTGYLGTFLRRNQVVRGWGVPISWSGHYCSPAGKWSSMTSYQLLCGLRSAAHLRWAHQLPAKAQPSLYMGFWPWPSSFPSRPHRVYWESWKERLEMLAPWVRWFSPGASEGACQLTKSLTVSSLAHPVGVRIVRCDELRFKKNITYFSPVKTVYLYSRKSRQFQTLSLRQ